MPRSASSRERARPGTRTDETYFRCRLTPKSTEGPEQHRQGRRHDRFHGVEMLEVGVVRGRHIKPMTKYARLNNELTTRLTNGLRPAARSPEGAGESNVMRA